MSVDFATDAGPLVSKSFVTNIKVSVSDLLNLLQANLDPTLRHRIGGSRLLFQLGVARHQCLPNLVSHNKSQL